MIARIDAVTEIYESTAEPGSAPLIAVPFRIACCAVVLVQRLRGGGYLALAAAPAAAFGWRSPSLAPESGRGTDSENKAKMSAGTPLTDDDRMPWLGAVR